MNRVLVVACASLWVAGAALAQDNPVPADPISDQPAYVDLHHHNRAIAFGSLILAANGGHPDEWKEVRAYDQCAPRPAPIDDPVSLTDPVPAPIDPVPMPPPPPSTCKWSVFYTTQYHFIQCPNGRVAIGRSGEGVSLESSTVGSVFSWTELVSCGDGLATGMDPATGLGPIDISKIERMPL